MKYIFWNREREDCVVESKFSLGFHKEITSQVHLLVLDHVSMDILSSCYWFMC